MRQPLFSKVDFGRLVFKVGGHILGLMSLFHTFTASHLMLSVSESDKDKQVKEEIVRPSSTASDMFKTCDIIRHQYVILTMVIIAKSLR